MMDLKKKAQQLKTDIPAVFVALKHKGTPWFAKILAAIIICYALSPIDLIPDFIPVLGYLDDLLLLPLLVWLLLKLIPDEVFAECRKTVQAGWQAANHKSWYYAIPIVVIWLFLIYLVVKAIIT